MLAAPARRALLLPIVWAWATAVAAAPPDADGRLTLRLRDAALSDVFYVLHDLTGQGYLVDGDVVGRADVEIVDATADEVDRALEGLGPAFSLPGPLRRVSPAGRDPAIPRSGVGDPISLAW